MRRTSSRSGTTTPAGATAKRTSRGALIATRARSDDALVVLAGDLNDVPGSPPLVHLEKDFGLYRVTSLLGPGRRVLDRVPRSSTELVDHLYVPDSARDHVRRVDVMRGASVGYAGSDHAAVRAAFAWGEDGGTFETCVEAD